jgi:uncharacterized membrane protein
MNPLFGTKEKICEILHSNDSILINNVLYNEIMKEDNFDNLLILAAHIPEDNVKTKILSIINQAKTKYYIKIYCICILFLIIMILIIFFFFKYR